MKLNMLNQKLTTMKTTEFLILRQTNHLIRMGAFTLIFLSFIFQSCQDEIISPNMETESYHENVLKSATISGESINDLILTIQNLSDEGKIEPGLANALISKLESALVNLEKGKEKVAANLLNAVLNQLESLVSGGVIDSETGDDLMADTHEALGDLSFTDQRDGKVYQTIVIGDQCWMAENLAYDIGSGCWVYNNDELNLEIYGRLYTWDAALTACPSGWHLPSDGEWEQLASYISEIKGPYSNTAATGDDWEMVGNHLKATTGWNNDGNGTDDFGFSGFPGGFHSSPSFGSVFGQIGNEAHWWTSTEVDTYPYVAWSRTILYDYDLLYRTQYIKEYAFSVRCVKD